MPIAVPTERVDFSRLDRASGSQLRTVHAIQEDLARALTSSLSTYLRNVAEFTVSSIDQVSFPEFLKGLASPTCLAYIDAKPYDSVLLMEITTPIVLTMVELLLGGPAREAPAVERQITAIEKGILQGVLRVIFGDLQTAWKRVDDLRFSLHTLAGETQNVHVVSPGEGVVSVVIDVKVGPSAGTMRLAIPAGLLKRLRSRFEQKPVEKTPASPQDRERMAQILSSGTLAFEARLNPTRVSASELVGLEVGDVLMLSHSLDQPVLGTLNGQVTYSGNLVLEDGKLVMQVAEVSPESTTAKFVRQPTQ